MFYEIFISLKINFKNKLLPYYENSYLKSLKIKKYHSDKITLIDIFVFVLTSVYLEIK